MTTNRRKFIRDSAFLAAGSALVSSVSLQEVFAAPKKSGANDKINVALIGCRSHGFNILKHHLAQPDVNCVALCDVDQNVLDAKVAEVGEITGKKPLQYNDYRKMLENKDIDAVIVGTPDHWHCLQMVDACAAGKDVYVEKPMANSIGECNLMVAAARKYNRVVQVGQQQRSGEHWMKIMNLIDEGRIGQVRQIKVWGNFHYGIGQVKVADSPVPAGVDFETWLGPAPARSFNTARYHGSWRMFWDYGGGLMTDWGVHLIDMALWAKKVDYLPISVSATGGNYSFPDNSRETPDTLSVIYEMNDFVLTWDHVAGTQNGPYDMLYGLAFIGDNATIVANRERWELKPEWRNDAFVTEAIPEQKGRSYHADHVRNFLDCIKSRKDPNCTVETGRLVATYAHMGNLSVRCNDRLRYDEKLNVFTDNKYATELITPTYRAPWVLPVL